MINQTTIISDLKKLCLTDSIDIGGFFDPTTQFEYESIKHYLNSLKNQTKPETASAELFRDVIKDILGLETYSEVNIGSGFIDFAIKESVGNPILFELKPLFKLIKSRNEIKKEELSFEDYQTQILKYLKKMNTLF